MKNNWTMWIFLGIPLLTAAFTIGFAWGITLGYQETIGAYQQQLYEANRRDTIVKEAMRILAGSKYRYHRALVQATIEKGSTP